MTTVQERFLRYVAVDTGSSETSGAHPSTEKQWTLARMLVDELREMGVADARVDEHCYVYGSIAANVQGAPAIGLIAHMDTAPAVATGPVHARILHYEGGDVQVGHGAVIRAAEYDSLARHIGQDLIVTDGTTLLGGDDKAGIAEIMTCCEALLTDSSIPHGKVCIAFTPDEEVGEGADFFDVESFGADFAYTFDGGAIGELEYENFNAASARVTVHGFNIHPGSAKNKMRNACRIAMEFAGMLPAHETPEHTENREGFYHLMHMEGDEETAKLSYIVRDHDRALFEARKQRLQAIADYLNVKYGADVVELELKDSYYNMLEKVQEHPEVIERALNAMRELGDTPVSVAIRGGTDGARLSFMGLPCPNLPTGVYNMHGVLEYASIPEMQHEVELALRIVRA